MTLTLLLSFMMIVLTLISRQQHILPMLLCLESLTVFMMYYLPLTTNNMLMNMNPSTIILLTMSTLSASISLSLMVSITRKEGNDSTMSSTSYTC